MLDIGSLRKRILLQRRSIGQDPSGEQLEVWSDLGRAWGSIRGLAAREQVSANTVHASDSHEIIMRYFPGLSPKDRAVYIDDLGTQHLYNLTSVADDDELHRTMTCTAVEGLSPG